MVVLFNLIEFVELVGLIGVVYGLDLDEQINMVVVFVCNFIRVQNLFNFVCVVKELFVEGWVEMGMMLIMLVDGVDLVMMGQIYYGVVVNVVEYYDILVVVLYYFLMQVNG